MPAGSMVWQLRAVARSGWRPGRASWILCWNLLSRPGAVVLRCRSRSRGWDARPLSRRCFRLSEVLLWLSRLPRVLRRYLSGVVTAERIRVNDSSSSTVPSAHPTIVSASGILSPNS